MPYDGFAPTPSADVQRARAIAAWGEGDHRTLAIDGQLDVDVRGIEEGDRFQPSWSSDTRLDAERWIVLAPRAALLREDA